MTHEDYTKKRDAITVSYGPLALEVSVDENAQKAIDALVLQVIGDNEPYLRGRQFYASPKAFKNAAMKIENELRTEQRKTVQGDK